MDGVDELIREIASNHGVAIGRDDPIMILHTMNLQLAKDTKIAQQQLLDTLRTELEEVAFRWGEEAKHKAERILNAALEGTSKTMQRTIEEQSERAVSAIETASNRAVATIDAKLDEARRFSALSFAGSLVVIVATTAMFLLAR